MTSDISSRRGVVRSIGHLAFIAAVDSIYRPDVRTVVAAAGAAGGVLAFVSRRPTPAEVRRLFGPVSDELARGASRIAREISAAAFRNRALETLVARRGLAPAVGLITPESGTALAGLRVSRGPCVLLTWHLGPGCGLAAAFERFGVDLMGVSRRQRSTLAGGHAAIAAGELASRTAALWKAVQHLKNGGRVVIAADGAEGERGDAVPCLGRMVQLGRGPFVLARLSGAPLVPIVSEWTSDGRIRVRVEPALDMNGHRPADGMDFERAAARAAAAWFDECVRRSPESLRPRTLRRLLRAPQASTSGLET